MYTQHPIRQQAVSRNRKNINLDYPKMFTKANAFWSTEKHKQKFHERFKSVLKRGNRKRVLNSKTVSNT